MPVTARAPLAALLLAAVFGAVFGAAACSDEAALDARRAAAAMTGGDPERGAVIARKYGCQTCHTIPGVVGADGLVGPPLGGIAARSYLGGVLPNTPGNMIRWIRDPKGVDSLTAMPNTGVTESDARHIAAYLYTLR